VSAETKLELLGLIDQAVGDGWPHTRACRVLDLADVRAHRWRARLRETGALDDRPPVGDAVHRLLAWEEQAILDLIEQWGWVDRSHGKLAHRGSYTGQVFVSPSTLLRVALKHRVTLPSEPFRPRPVFACYATGSMGAQSHLDMGRATPTSLDPIGSPTRSSTSSPDTGSDTCSPASKPRPRRSCYSPAPWRTSTSSTLMACRPPWRTGWRSWSRGQTTRPR
jgi:hypothetical protein